MRGDRRHHHHFHERQGAGLVGADSRHRAEGFHRREPPDDGVARGHALHADCQCDGDERRQTFWDDGYRDADDGLEDVYEFHAPQPSAVGKQQNAGNPDHGGKGVAEFLNLTQQRRFKGADRGHHLVDATQFGIRAGCNHDPGTAPGRDECAGECHAFPIPYRGFSAHGGGGLVDWHRLARQRRFLGPQVLDLDEPKVGRNLVTRLKQHDVAGH